MFILFLLKYQCILRVLQWFWPDVIVFNHSRSIVINSVLWKITQFLRYKIFLNFVSLPKVLRASSLETVWCSCAQLWLWLCYNKQIQDCLLFPKSSEKKSFDVQIWCHWLLTELTHYNALVTYTYPSLTWFYGLWKVGRPKRRLWIRKEVWQTGRLIRC